MVPGKPESPLLHGRPEEWRGSWEKISVIQTLRANLPEGGSAGASQSAEWGKPGTSAVPCAPWAVEQVLTGWGWGVLLLWGWGHLACTPTWTSRSLNRTSHCPCSTCQQSPHQVLPSSGPLPHPLQMSQTWGPTTTAQVPDCTADQPSQLPPQIGEYPSGGGHFPPCNHCVARVSLGHLTLLLNVLSCLHPTCPFRQTDDTPRGTKTHLISHPGVQGPLSVLSFSFSLSLRLPLSLVFLFSFVLC